MVKKSTTDMACEELTASVMTIDAEKASEFIENYNGQNRPLRKGKVLELAGEMLVGGKTKNFMENGESICFTREGYLVQGQHRMHAVIEAEKMRQKDPKTYGKTPVAFKFVVVQGVDARAIHTFDATKAARSGADVLFLENAFNAGTRKDASRYKKLCSILDKAARTAWLYSQGADSSKIVRFSHPEMLAFIKENGDLKEYAEFILDEDAGEKRLARVLNLGTAAGLMYLFSRSGSEMSPDQIVDEGAFAGRDISYGDLAREFFVKLGARTEKLFDTVYMHIIDVMQSPTKYSPGAKEQVFVKAWLAYFNGDDVHKNGRKKEGYVGVREDDPTYYIGGLHVPPEQQEIDPGMLANMEVLGLTEADLNSKNKLTKAVINKAFTAAKTELDSNLETEEIDAEQHAIDLEVLQNAKSSLS